MLLRDDVMGDGRCRSVWAEGEAGEMTRLWEGGLSYDDMVWMMQPGSMHFVLGPAGGMLGAAGLVAGWGERVLWVGGRAGLSQSQGAWIGCGCRAVGAAATLEGANSSRPTDARDDYDCVDGEGGTWAVGRRTNKGAGDGAT